MVIFHEYTAGSGIFSLDDSFTGSLTIKRIINANNTFKERFRQTRFINTTLTDATIDTGSFTAQF